MYNVFQFCTIIFPRQFVFSRSILCARFHGQKYLVNGLLRDDPASTPAIEARAICQNAGILRLVNVNRASQVQGDFLSRRSFCGVLDGGRTHQCGFDFD